MAKIKNPERCTEVKAVLTPEEVKREKVRNRIGYELIALHDRWQDEREYEDWEEYIKRIKLLLSTHHMGEYVKMMKRPFQLTYKIGEVSCTLKVTNTLVTYTEEVL